MPSTREFAGLLNKLVTLESPSETGGDATVTWTTIDTVWAQMEGLSGADHVGLIAEAGYRFTLRYRSDVTPQWRVGLNGSSRKFGIVSVLDPDGHRQRVVIVAQELIGP